jgi:ADP-ribosyl-[dinitrogen reductase] hydrolase
MQALETIIVDGLRRDRVIEVLEGDLTKLPPGNRFDVLVVSAFPNDYAPTPGSLIGSLHGRGLSVERLSIDKEFDLRSGFSCWLSRRIPVELGLGFDRILCYEPTEAGQGPADRIEDIFRALAPFVGLPENPVTSVAMPLIACGDQRTPVAMIAEPLIRAAVHWMKTSPLQRVAIVEREPSRVLALQEEALRVKKALIAEQTGPEKEYHVFLSYCRMNGDVADRVVETLRSLYPDIRVFRDIWELRTGKDFRVQLDQALRKSHRFLALLTPEYVSSNACKDEFNAAWSIREWHDPEFMLPLFVRSADLDDPRVKYLQYDDCREDDGAKIDDALRGLVRSLTGRDVVGLPSNHAVQSGASETRVPPLEMEAAVVGPAAAVLLQKPIENSYVIDRFPIAAGEYPFHKDPIKGAVRLEQILDAGATCFIDLTMPADGMEPYEAELQKQAKLRGRPLKRISRGIPDMHVPSIDGMTAVLDAIDDAVRDGERVYIHCWGGVGRTGTVIGCHFVRHGMSPDDALKKVGSLFATMSPDKRRRHPEGSPQTRAQREFVRSWNEPTRSSERPTAAFPAQEAALLVPPSWSEVDRATTRERQVGGDSVARALAVRDRVRGSLIGLAAGDALGTTVEFRAPGSFEPLTDMIGGGPFHLAPGEWTDDTSMALCLVESLTEKRDFDAADQMQRYVRWWREGHLSSTGRCFDIGITTREAIARFERTGEPYSGSTERSRAANGSLMRLAPVALFYWTSQDAIELSGRSSRTTHGSPLTVDACRYLGALIVGAVRGASRDELLAPTYEPWPGCWDEHPLVPEIAAIAAGSFRTKQPAAIRGTGYCVDALEAALWAFASSTDFQSGALLAVRRAVTPRLHLCSGTDATTPACEAPMSVLIEGLTLVVKKLQLEIGYPGAPTPSSRRRSSWRSRRASPVPVTNGWCISGSTTRITSRPACSCCTTTASSPWTTARSWTWHSLTSTTGRPCRARGWSGSGMRTGSRSPGWPARTRRDGRLRRLDAGELPQHGALRRAGRSRSDALPGDEQRAGNGPRPEDRPRHRGVAAPRPRPCGRAHCPPALLLPRPAPMEMRSRNYLESMPSGAACLRIEPSSPGGRTWRCGV